MTFVLVFCSVKLFSWFLIAIIFSFSWLYSWLRSSWFFFISSRSGPFSKSNQKWFKRSKSHEKLKGPLSIKLVKTCSENHLDFSRFSVSSKLSPVSPLAFRNQLSGHFEKIFKSKEYFGWIIITPSFCIVHSYRDNNLEPFQRHWQAQKV